MKKKSLILIICVIFMISIIGYIFLKSDKFFPDTNVWNINKDKKEDNKVVVGEKLEKDFNKETTPEVDNNIKGLEGEKIFEMNEEVTTEDLTYIVKSVSTTKERGNFPIPPKFELWTIDENGNLTDDNSYLVIGISIKNNGEVDKETYLNLNKLQVFDDNGEFISREELYIYSNMEGYERKDYFQITLKPGEEYDCDLVYIVKDQSLAYNNMLLYLDTTGVVGYTENNRYIKLQLDQ